MTRKWLASLGFILLIAALWGCGSNGGSGGSSTTPETPPQKVGSSSCKICHTAIVDQGFDNSFHANDAIAGCEGCHGGGQYHRGLGPIPFPEPSLVQCDECHDVTVRHINGDDPATSYPNDTTIEGYVNVADCLGCHAADTPAATTWQHDPKGTAINRQWANSAHAGHIATGPVTSATGDAWGHYNWDQTTGTGNRASCQRCHTSTGIRNYFANPAGYTPANNNFSHLVGWTAATGSGQNELLFCWGCHSDVGSGALRNPGAITENYAAVSTGGPVVTVNYPNINQSNVCMGCHLGREVGENIATDIDADGVRGFVNSHYLTAGATIFNESGYEYAGVNYDDFGYHKTVGVGNNQGTGSDGPCVTCHMTSGEPHTFSVVTKDANDNITSVASSQCVKCHTVMTPAVLETKKAEFHEALEELRLVMESKGMYFQARNPYIFVGPGPTDASFTNWAGVYGVEVWKDVMGAAFNYNLLEHDPGAYAHNAEYALKLIADSVDFLNDGQLDEDDSVASELLTKGTNISNQPGFAEIHAPVIGAASAAVCGSCHGSAAHFNVADKAAYMAENINCTDCHPGLNVRANPQILADYAEAGHADPTGAYSREEAGASCSRCHTTSGYIANLTSGGSYDYPNPEGQNRLQMLACIGCHTDLNTGARRPAPAFVATWTANNVTAQATYPHAGDSNLCVRCHSARRAGPNITDTATTTAHYLPIAASVFGGSSPPMVVVTANTSTSGPAVGTTFTGVGYEFAGQNYSGLGSHKFIGGAVSGPCVTCHMSGTAGHTWAPAIKDENDNFIAVTSGACGACHSGADAMTPAHLNASKAAFEARLTVLDNALRAKGFFFNPEDGRFYRNAEFSGTAVNNAYYVSQAALFSLDPADLECAAFNMWLYASSGGDPCGYIHNLLYAEKLIADSVDYLNDGIINGN